MAAAVVLFLAATAAPAAAQVTVSSSPAAPVAGETVTFTAASADPERPIASYAWEVDEDGDFDDSTEAVATRTYAAAGTYVVALLVVDSEGSPALVYWDVVVAEAPPPPPPAPPPPAPPPPPPAPPPPAEPPPLLSPFPVIRVAGQLTSTGARFTLITVRAPRRARIAVYCNGRGCPRRRVLRTGARLRRIEVLQGRYRAGARLTFRVTVPNRIGKFTRIVVRQGLRPARTDRCLWPGQRRPQACPT